MKGSYIYQHGRGGILCKFLSDPIKGTGQLEYFAVNNMVILKFSVSGYV